MHNPLTPNCPLDTLGRTEQTIVRLLVRSEEDLGIDRYRRAPGCRRRWQPQP